MSRKKKHEEHVNNERWLVSYADFITLLFAFFTSLYAISTVDAKKMGKLMYSTQAAFNVDFFPSNEAVLGLSSMKEPPAVEKPEAIDIERKKKKDQKKGGPPEAFNPNLLAKRLQNFVDNKKLANKVSVRRMGEDIIISLSEAAFFDAGSTTVRSASLPVLDAIVIELRDVDAVLRVEGHTDDIPVWTNKHTSNWQLSTDRSVSVVNYLVAEIGYPPDRLSAAGFAGYRPIGDNATVEGRAMNRRVDLVLVSNRTKAKVN